MPDCLRTERSVCALLWWSILIIVFFSFFVYILLIRCSFPFLYIGINGLVKYWGFFFHFLANGKYSKGEDWLKSGPVLRRWFSLFWLNCGFFFFFRLFFGLKNLFGVNWLGLGSHCNGIFCSRKIRVYVYCVCWMIKCLTLKV